MDHVAVVPLRLNLEMLQHPTVFGVHLRAVSVLLVGIFAVEDDAYPDLVRVGRAAEDRVVNPACRWGLLKSFHVPDELVLMSRFHGVLGNRAVHLKPPCTKMRRPCEATVIVRSRTGSGPNGAMLARSIRQSSWGIRRWPGSSTEPTSRTAPARWSAPAPRPACLRKP